MKNNTNDSDRTIDLRPESSAGEPMRSVPPNYNGPAPGSHPPYGGMPPRYRYPRTRWPVFAVLGLLLVGVLGFIFLGAAIFAVNSDVHSYAVEFADEAVMDAYEYVENGGYEYAEMSDLSEAFIHETFPVGDIKKLDIDLSVSNILFVPAESNQIEVRWTTNGSSERLGANVRQEEGVLHISENANLKAVDFTGDFPAESHIEIALPYIMMENIDISTVSGDVNIDSDVFTTDRFQLTSFAGDVYMSDLNATNAAAINLTSGNFTCGNLKTGEFNFTSVYGAFNAFSVVCQKVSVQTTSAAFYPTSVYADQINIETVDGETGIDTLVAQEMHVISSTGSIRLDAPSVTTMRFETVSGNIDLQNPDFTDLAVETVTSDFTMILDNGDPVSLSAKTITGSVNNNLPEAADAGRQISFQSVSGSIFIN